MTKMNHAMKIQTVSKPEQWQATLKVRLVNLHRILIDRRVVLGDTDEGADYEEDDDEENSDDDGRRNRCFVELIDSLV